MEIAQYYRELIKDSGTVVEETLSDQEALGALTVCHNFLVDFDALRTAIAERPEVQVFDAGLKEYQFALSALTSGHYRYAFIGLRLFFELSLATVQFSAHEIDLRLWLKNSKDINWSALKDSQAGVFSPTFLDAFTPGFSDYAKQYLAIAEAVYRECSEFVHGNAFTHHTLPSKIYFDQNAFGAWCEKAETMRLVVVFLFAGRYLLYVRDEERNSMESVVLDAIGHHSVVQAAFSLARGEQRP